MLEELKGRLITDLKGRTYEVIGEDNDSVLAVDDAGTRHTITLDAAKYIEDHNEIRGNYLVEANRLTCPYHYAWNIIRHHDSWLYWEENQQAEREHNERMQQPDLVLIDGEGKGTEEWTIALGSVVNG